MNPRLVLPALIGLWIAVLASAAAAIHFKHESRTLFVKLEQLTAERDRLNVEWGRLQLEQSTLSMLGDVEQRARVRLEMQIPATDEVRIVTP